MDLRNVSILISILIGLWSIYRTWRNRIQSNTLRNNDLKHLTQEFRDFRKEVDNKFEGLWKETRKQGERIASLEGRRNDR